MSRQGTVDEAEPSAEYDAWDATLAEIAASAGTALVVGASDVGKTTFCRLLANRLLAAGRSIALLDADPGQSEIGPPACAGLAIVDGPMSAFESPAATALAFVGATSPAAHLPEQLTAIRRLADLAAGRTLVVDTPGYVLSRDARLLLQCEVDLLAPAHIVGLQRDGELTASLAAIRRRSGCRLHLPPIPAAIGRKSPALRSQRRATRFAAYFESAMVVSYAFADVAFGSYWLGTGATVAAHILRFLNQTLPIGIRVYHAEMSGRHLGLMVNRPVDLKGPEVGVIMSQLKARELSVTVAPRLKNLIVGLEASNGKLLGLGTIVQLEFRRGEVGILTPVRGADAAAIIRLGTQRIAPDGSDAGSLRPDEL